MRRRRSATRTAFAAFVWVTAVMLALAYITWVAVIVLFVILNIFAWRLGCRIHRKYLHPRAWCPVNQEG